MEKNLTATFHNVDNLEQAAEQLKQQGVLYIQFNNHSSLLVEYQSESMVQSMEHAAASPSYELRVCVQKSRYRQAEDTITKFGGQLHE
ncbi:hypothetical protein [Paenibacillus sedimenti]|uniref:Uncharacterized protein n=1 Tax=Paenibacillus sedimenti TaxID=2770274 RepID=A0A926KU72_9BACL|nr:hypothetical protein [Paenibacillus sedimenti]MBD0382229.1 hypothetical protein [Paenibacillus sedimenti]